MSNMYGYTDDESLVGGSSPFNFGLNAAQAVLSKFEWTDKGGAGGTDLEAVDITFNVAGKDVSCRKFPVKKVFGKEGQVFEDPNVEEAKPLFRAAMEDFNGWMVALLKCYVDAETIQKAMSVPINNFKEYVAICKALIPANHAEIKLDIFMEYQWQITGENKITFLQVPNKAKQGKFICAAVVPAGTWKTVKTEHPEDKERKALKYVDDNGAEHPFTRTGWYMNSNYANQQKEEGTEAAQPAIHNTTASNATANDAAATGEVWS